MSGWSLCLWKACTWAKPTVRSSWAVGEVAWEATAQRQADREKAQATASASQEVRARMQEEIAVTKQQRRRATREREYARQLERQREEIQPSQVLETLASMQPPAPPNVRLPEAKPDPDREYPVQILPIRPYEREDNGCREPLCLSARALARPLLNSVSRDSCVRHGALVGGMCLLPSQAQAAPMGIRDLSAQASREAGLSGGRRYPVLAVAAPKNDPKEAALGN